MDLEWLILADAAQVVDGKLYLMGGGWDVVTVNTGFPIQKHASIVAAFQVPWNETNERHQITIELADEDGQTIMRMDGEVEVGRPAGIAAGQSQRLQLALESMLHLQRPGTYVITASIRNEEKGRITFRAVPGPMMALRS